MTTPVRLFVSALCLCVSVVSPLRAAWEKTDTTLAWKSGEQVVWRFSFDPAKGKPFFNPVTVDGGPSLVDFRPADHPWHYGLWFSWKTINGTNYWEENRQTGKSDGKTAWEVTKLETRDDGSATIHLDVSYTPRSGEADLTEKRVLVVSAPKANGTYTIDWTCDFTAGPRGAELGRTPMPTEPNGRHNGGYAGLSLRLAHLPLTVDFLTTAGLVTEFVTDRARPTAPAFAANFVQEGRPAGTLALLSADGNIFPNTPWYLAKNREMNWACAAILAPEVRKLPAGGTWQLRYRVLLQSAPLTPATLQAAFSAWTPAK